jgi:hypothetical protein
MLNRLSAFWFFCCQSKIAWPRFKTRYIAVVKVENLETALHARPFRPFELRVNGEIIQVRHPEQVFLAGRKSTVVVDVGDRIHIMDCSHISKLSLLRRQNSPNGKQ